MSSRSRLAALSLAAALACSSCTDVSCRRGFPCSGARLHELELEDGAESSFCENVPEGTLLLRTKRMGSRAGRFGNDSKPGIVSAGFFEHWTEVRIVCYSIDESGERLSVQVSMDSDGGCSLPRVDPERSRAHEHDGRVCAWLFVEHPPTTHGVLDRNEEWLVTLERP